MTRNQFIAETDWLVKLVRTEYGLTQEAMAKALAFEDLSPSYPKTMGGRVWWRTVEVQGPFRIQHDIPSQHYRALDDQNGRAILRLVSLVMFAAAAVFVVCALSNPQLGRTIYFGTFAFGTEAWRMCCIIYAVATALFGASFFVKE